MDKTKPKRINEVQCEYYTPREIATLLNLSTDLVYGLLREGGMPAVKLGTGKRMIWRIPKTGFAEYIVQHSVSNQPKANIQPSISSEVPFSDD